MHCIVIHICVQLFSQTGCIPAAPLFWLHFLPASPFDFCVDILFDPSVVCLLFGQLVPLIPDQARTGRGIHGRTKVSCGPAMPPTLIRPAGAGHPPKRLYGRAGGLRPSSPPLDIPSRTGLAHAYFLVKWSPHTRCILIRPRRPTFHHHKCDHCCYRKRNQWQISFLFWCHFLCSYWNRGEFHDQGDAKWIVIRRSLWGHNDTPFRRNGLFSYY